MNGFVNYLNTMNNAGSNSVATLAEAQVTSEYYSKIQVKRKLADVIVKRIRDKIFDTVILTGHAGDGKTSILVQVLSELKMLRKQQPLEEEAYYEADDLKLYAVKDMSELSEAKQIEYCKKAFESAKKNTASILISNTGPLLNCIREVYKENCQEEGITCDETKVDSLINNVLDRLDRSKLETLSIGSYNAIIINIARVDNVGFVSEIIPKLVADELWDGCTNCSKCNCCPIYNNIKMLKNHDTRIINFITAYFRFLYESDRRMTIRQMISQISYAITGNLVCNKVQTIKAEENKFKYLFVNLFFGYEGLKKVRKADQITGIKNIRNLNLDTIALKEDYDFFVANDFDSYIPMDIRQIVKKQNEKFLKRHINIEKAEVFNKEDIEYRKAIRRIYIMTGLSDNSEYAQVYDEIFGNGFNTYMKLINGNLSKREIKIFEKIIIDALYIEMTGTQAKENSFIPLTIRRNDGKYQKAMIVAGKIKKEDIRIVIEPNDSGIDDDGKNKVFLSIGNDKRFELSLPLALYFEKIASGAVFVSANPELTHGISKLEVLLREYGKSNNTSDMEILLNKTDKPIFINMDIDADKIYFDER